MLTIRKLIYLPLLLLIGLFAFTSRVAAAPVQTIGIGGGTQKIALSQISYFAVKWTGSNAVIKYSWDGLQYTNLTINDDTASKDGTNATQVSDLTPIPSGKSYLFISSSGASNIQVSLFNTSDVPTGDTTANVGQASTPGEVNLSSGASYSALNIVSRQDWGANESYMTWKPEYRKINKIIVHHTAWTNNTADYSATVRAIYYYHAVTLGWGDIGYNYLIAPDGTIFEGRTGGDGAIGAHAYHNNSGAIGIAFMGTYSTSLPTPAALTAFKNLVVEKSLLHGIVLSWHTTVYGHRDMPDNSTSCPGQSLYDYLSTLVTDAETQRQADALTNPITAKRTAMLSTLQNYTDVRLKLNYVGGASLTDDLVRNLIPANSGIAKIMSISSGSAIIYIKSEPTYNGVTYDDTADRLQLLYLIFSLDPSVASIDLLTVPDIVEVVPDNKQLEGDSVSIWFSKPVIAGSGQVEIHRASDQTLFAAIDVSALTINGREVVIDPPGNWEYLSNYYVTVCSTCFKDANNNVYPGETDPNFFRFSVPLQWLDWQKQSGQTSDPIAMEGFNGRLYQAVRGNGSPYWIYVRSTADGLFDNSDAGEVWDRTGINGYTTRQLSMTVFDNGSGPRLYLASRGSDSKIYTKSMGTDGVWDANWSEGGGTTTNTIAMKSFNGRLYQAVRGNGSNRIFVRSSSDGKFDGGVGENWIEQTGQTYDDMTLEMFNSQLYLGARGATGRLFVRNSADGVTWGGWRELLGVTATTPAILAKSGSYLYMSMSDASGSIMSTRSSDGINWSMWTSVGTLVTPSRVEMKPFGADLYQSVRSNDAAIYLRKFKN